MYEPVHICVYSQTNIFFNAHRKKDEKKATRWALRIYG